MPTLLASLWGWLTSLTTLVSPSTVIGFALVAVAALTVLLPFLVWLLSDDDRTIRAATLLEALPWGRRAKE